MHGIGQSVSSAFRTIGPVFSGGWYGVGLEMGVVGFAWWLVALVSGLGCLAAVFVYEGSGHEVLLPGEVVGEDGTVIIVNDNGRGSSRV